MQLNLRKDLSNQEIADLFEFIAAVLIVKQANPYRIRAYEVAGYAISQLPIDIVDMIRQHESIDEIPGIGEAISQKLHELVKTGHITAFEEYVQDIPAGMKSLLQVRGIGPKTAFLFSSLFHLHNEATALDEVKKLCEQHQISQLEHFGEKSENAILQAINDFKSTHNRLSYPIAKQQADELIGLLKKCSGIDKIEALGSLRRQSSTVGDIDLGLTVTNLDQVKSYVKNIANVKRVISIGDQMMRLILKNDLQVDLKIVPNAEWGSFIQHFTGSKAHNIKLREYANKLGYSLSEHGIKSISDHEIITFTDEKEFYQFLKLKWIPPQDRKGEAEIELAKM
jgi:DNA polymerase (family 10)